SRRSRAGSSPRRTAGPFQAARAPPPERSQRDAVLPDGDLAEAVALVARLDVAAGDVEDQREQLVRQLVEAGGPFRDRPGVEVDPGGLAPRQIAVGADLDRGRREAERRAAAGG